MAIFGDNVVILIIPRNPDGILQTLDGFQLHVVVHIVHMDNLVHYSKIEVFLVI